LSCSGTISRSPEDDERTRREKVAGRIAILDRSLEDTLPYLLALLGIVEGDDPLAQMDGQIKKRRIKRILLRESLNQPLIVIFEDPAGEGNRSIAGRRISCEDAR
jgi:hypothetical protein